MACEPSQPPDTGSPSAAAPVSDWVLTLPLSGAIDAGFDRSRFTAHGDCLAFVHGWLHDASAPRSAWRVRGTAAAEYVLARYARCGEAALPALRGSFALVLVDRSLARIVVARDPVGTLPLFFATRGTSVLVAGSPRTLIRQPGISADLNPVALADRLCLRWPDPAETFFAAVRRVLPGSRLTIQGGQAISARYWDPLPDDQPVRWSRADEAERFDEALDRAVDRCLPDGPGAIFLSGGLDSISVAAVAADRAAAACRPLPLALSLAFPDPACDERHVQASVARDLRLPQDLVEFDVAVGSRGLLAEALDLSATLPAPLLNTWSPAYLALARGARATHGVQAILTGTGGDEWLSVSPYFAADLMRRGDVAGLARFAAAWRRSHRQSAVAFARSLAWTFGLRPLAGMWLHRIAPEAHAASRARRLTASDPSWVAPDPHVRAQQARRAPACLGAPAPRQGFYLQEVRTGLDHALASHELEELSQLGDRVGVGFAHPFWDADLVDMLYRLPPDLLNAGGRSKGLVRATLARRFPELGFERQRKVSATSFSRSLVRREAPAIARTVGPLRTLDALGVVEARGADEYLRQTLDGSRGAMYRVWDLLNLEHWARCQVAGANG